MKRFPRPFASILSLIFLISLFDFGSVSTENVCFRVWQFQGWIPLRKTFFPNFLFAYCSSTFISSSYCQFISKFDPQRKLAPIFGHFRHFGQFQPIQIWSWRSEHQPMEFKYFSYLHHSVHKGSVWVQINKLKTPKIVITCNCQWWKCWICCIKLSQFFYFYLVVNTLKWALTTLFTAFRYQLHSIESNCNLV